MRRSGWGWRALVLAVALVGGPGPAAGQELSRAGVDVDNDIFATFHPTRGTDYEYTHGLRMWGEWTGGVGPLADAMQRVAGCAAGADVCRTRFGLGQQMYTPRRERDEGPIAGERPHAGWLYLSLELRTEVEGTSGHYGVELGVVGPPALAQELQETVHAAFDFREPKGWEHQLPFEPGIQVRAGRSTLRPAFAAKGVQGAVGYGWRAHLGNVRTGGEASLRGELCYGAISCTAAAHGSRSFGVALGGWIAPNAVVHNVFLDGPLFREGHAVERKVWVLRRGVGLRVAYRGLTLRYALHQRGREYHTEPGRFAYATIGLSYRP